jgi:hypothetical protein
VQPGGAGQIAEPADAVAEQDQRQRRRHRKSDPGGQRARHAGAQDAETHPDLAACRPGQELAQRDDVGVTMLVKPFAALDAFGPKIAEMRDRTAKACHAEPQKGPEHLADRAGRPCRPGLGILLCVR